MTIRCPQCAGDVRLPESLAVAHCPFCESSLYVDLGGVLLHKLLRRELSEREARRLTRVFDPKVRARIVSLPFWAFDRGTRGLMTPADSSLVEDVDKGPALAGHESWFTSEAEEGRAAVPPDIPLGAVIDESEREALRPRLVHIPFYVFEHNGQSARVDAVEGRLITRWDDAGGATLGYSRSTLWMLVFLFFLAGIVPGSFSVILYALIGGGAYAFLRRGATA